MVRSSHSLDHVLAGDEPSSQPKSLSCCREQMHQAGSVGRLEHQVSEHFILSVSTSQATISHGRTQRALWS